MLKVAHICDEEYYVSDQDYAALELSYLAIDSGLQRNGIGTKVLNILTSYARDISDTLPIRFLVLDAFEDKVDWYKKAGFGEYPKRADLRYPGTVAMKMDFIDKCSADAYAESHA